MPQDNLYPAILNLDEYDIFLEEELDNSNYIEIDKFPNTIGYGKHYFLLSWKKNTSSQYTIKDGSKLLFELKDSDGNVIFSELSNTLPIKVPLSVLLKLWLISSVLFIFIKASNPVKVANELILSG